MLSGEGYLVAKGLVGASLGGMWRVGILMTLAVVLMGVSGLAWGRAADTSAEAADLASSRISAEHMQQYSDLAVTWLQEYLRVDTTNPPGNEMRAVAFFKKILDAEGIGNPSFELAPGRGDLWARLPHTTAEGDRPIIFLN